MPTVHLLIKGKVQGVFYRNTAKEMADKKGIQGWVRNTPNGDVEITASGDEHALKEYAEWCYAGPRLANVEEIIATEMVDENFTSFEIKR